MLLLVFLVLLHSTQFALKIIATKKTQSFKTSWKMRLKLEKFYAQNYYNIYNKSVCGCFELTCGFSQIPVIHSKITPSK